MNLQWFYNRLRSMGPGEILWRVRRLGGQWQARALRPWRERYYRRCATDPAALLRMSQRVHFYGLQDIRPEQAPAVWKKRTIGAADRLMNHRYSLFAVEDIDLGEPVPFNKELKRQIETPLEFGPWMDYRDTERYGDFKYFWELPRLQHLITLAKAYYLTQKTEYADEIGRQLAAFEEQSPYLLGVNWIMPMEASIRLVSVCWIVGFLTGYLKDRPDVCSTIERMVKSHVDYVAANYAAYSSANNHLVGEAAGVFIAATCFGELARMQRHRRKAFEILCREIAYQHYSDGVNKEQAIHYQMFCFDFFLMAGLLAQDNGMDVPMAYWEVLEKSATFIAAMRCGDHPAAIGDSDDGRAVLLGAGDDDEAGSLIASAAVLFGRGDLARRAGGFDEKSFWLMGETGEETFERLMQESVCDRVPTRFPEGGYYVLSSERPVRAKLIFDCGPLGFESIAAHGHADSLSFVLSVDDKEVLIDPGTYTYVAGDPMRDYFRSTAAHNTVAIDGLDQSQMAGPFLWSTKAKSQLDEWTDNEWTARIAGRHDGYKRLADPVIHKRQIEFDKVNGVITITDAVECRQEHRVQQFFHLAPECEIRRAAENVFEIRNGAATIVIETDPRLKADVVKGGDATSGGWMSPAYDVKTPTHSIVATAAGCLHQMAVTRIRLTMASRNTRAQQHRATATTPG